MTTEIYREKLDELEKTLKEQIKLVDKNDYRTIYDEIVSCEEIIEELCLNSVSGDIACGHRRREVMELYHLLILMLDTGKARVSDQLNKLRKNRKTVVLYKDGPDTLV